MAALPNTSAFLQDLDRRSFLWSLASFGLTAKKRKSEKQAETVYRFLTAECEVRMSVEFFDSSSIHGFRFRDQVTNRGFCLSATGDQGGPCLQRFVGSMAIARYNFQPRVGSGRPFNVRERVVTIDHDSRMNPRPPYERTLLGEREVMSDIQAFGYNPDDSDEAASYTKPFTLWSLLRQDLYLNDQAAAFLIVHWKHTLNLISLVDVIPGDGTQMVSE
jgi:hypothetical protein